MDFLRQQLAVLQERLAGLTASQKMLTAALAVILVMTMLYWGRFASSSERVALLPNALAGEELTNVTNALRARNIDYTVDAGKVMVPAERKVEAFGEIAFVQALPANSADALDAMFEKVTPWATSQDYSTRLNHANQQNIAAVLKTWKGVKNAVVLIADGGNNTALSRREPRLSVNLSTKGDVDRRAIAAAARGFLINTVSGLDSKRISVTVDMQTFSGNDEGGIGAGGGADALVLKQQTEELETNKLRNSLPGIAGLTVQVSVEVDSSSSSETKRTLNPKSKVELLSESRRETSTPVAVGAQATEPGVVANTALDVRSTASAPAATSGTATERVEEKFTTDYERSDIQKQTPGGQWKVVGATIGVPRSYFVEIWRRTQGPANDPGARPTPEQLEPVVSAEKRKMQEQARSLLPALTDEKNISVLDYWDFEPIVGGPVLAAATPGGAANLTLLATNHAREVAVGVLAVASLFMVSRMVKKTAPAAMPQLAVAGAGGAMTADDTVAALATGKAPGKPMMVNGEDIAGEVGDSSPVMFATELDNEVLETSQMIEQVAGFVKQNPDAAAQMINQWMSRD